MTYVPTRSYPADHPAMKTNAKWICGKCGVGNLENERCIQCNQVRTQFG